MKGPSIDPFRCPIDQEMMEPMMLRSQLPCHAALAESDVGQAHVRLQMQEAGLLDLVGFLKFDRALEGAVKGLLD